MTDKEYQNLVSVTATQAEVLENATKLAIQTEATTKQYNTMLLRIITDQRAEIDRLNRENKILSKNADNAFQEGLNENRELFEPEIKAQAYKEFADRLKEKIITECCRKDFLATKAVDDLLKEMVGYE